MKSLDVASGRVAVPFNDPSREVAATETELLQAITRVLRSGRYILGPEVEAFEQEFGALVGGREIVAVGNGTDALELALRAAGVGAGDEVLTVANAGGYTSTACFSIGALPRYVDVDPASLLIDPTLVKAAVTHLTKAVVVTHLYGQLADVRRVCEAAGPGVAVIEDCAQAHGAVFPDGSAAGAIGDLATFSFYPTKNLGAIGDGGAVAAESEMAARIRRLRMYGWHPKYHVVDRGGRNSRLDELQAAILRLRLKELSKDNARRRAIVERYRAAGSRLQFIGGLDSNAHHLCVVRDPDRDGLRTHLAELGISSDVHYPLPDHRQPAWSDQLRVNLPETDAACSQVLSLPCFPELTAEEVATTCEALRGL